jgi:hypothetical protein
LRRIVLVAVIACTLISCQKKKEGDGMVSLNFPAASFKASGKITALSINFANVCYMANVIGGGISAKKGGSCDVPMGVHSNFVAPAASTTLLVPRGSGYSIEIFAFARNAGTDPCPTFNSDSISGLDLSKVYLVGKSTFNMDAADVSVDVGVADPGSNVAAMYAMPGTCVASAPPVSGAIITGANGYKLYRSVDESDGPIRISPEHGFGLVLRKDGSQ